MDLGEHKASEADKTWIANFGDSIRTMSISQPVCMSITARLFQGQVQACQPNFDLHESPFWWLIYDVFLCFCALLILYLCLFYCNWFLVLHIFEIWSSTCCVLLLLLFEVWRWKPSHSRIASEPALAGKNQPAEGNNVALVSPPWRQVLRDQQVLRSTKMPSKDPTLWLCCIISLSPRTILMIWRGNDRTHIWTQKWRVWSPLFRKPRSLKRGSCEDLDPGFNLHQFTPECS